MQNVPRPGSAPPALPLRDGVSASCLVLPSSRRPLWPSLLDALAERLPSVSRADWQQRLDACQVCNAWGQPLAAHSPTHSGQRVYYWRHVPDEPELPFTHQVLYQDHHLLVVDKPHWVPVTPAGRYARSSLLARLKRELGLPELSPIHRIDRETAGLVAFALRPQDRGAYQALFRERVVHKVYEAVAPSPPPERSWPVLRHTRLAEDEQAFFRMHEVPGPPDSETRVQWLRHVPGTALSLYRLEPITGKRHQLRVHMAGLGLPIANDVFYPSVTRGPDQPDDYPHPLQLLARRLAFVDPITGVPHRFSSQLQLAMAQHQPPH